MRTALKSGTDTAAHLIGDPVALLPLSQRPYDGWFDDFGREALRHHALLVSTGSDGGIDLLVCVEEDAPEMLRANAVAVSFLPPLRKMSAIESEAAERTALEVPDIILELRRTSLEEPEQASVVYDLTELPEGPPTA